MLGAQAADDLLLRLGIDLKFDRRVLLDEAGQRTADLAPVALLGDLDGHAVAADGVDRRGQRDDAGRVAEGIAGLGGSQLSDRADVTGSDLGVSVCFCRRQSVSCPGAPAGRCGR